MTLVPRLALSPCAQISTELCWTGPEETDTQYGLDWADQEETDTQYGLYWADIVGCALGRTSGRQLRAHHYTRAFDFDPVGACPVAADVVSEKRQRDPFASPVPCSVSRWRRRPPPVPRRRRAPTRYARRFPSRRAEPSRERFASGSNPAAGIRVCGARQLRFGTPRVWLVGMPCDLGLFLILLGPWCCV